MSVLHSLKFLFNLVELYCLGFDMRVGLGVVLFKLHVKNDVFVLEFVVFAGLRR